MQLQEKRAFFRMRENGSLTKHAWKVHAAIRYDGADIYLEEDDTSLKLFSTVMCNGTGGEASNPSVTVDAVLSYARGNVATIERVASNNSTLGTLEPGQVLSISSSSFYPYISNKEITLSMVAKTLIVTQKPESIEYC